MTRAAPLRLAALWLGALLALSLAGLWPGPAFALEVPPLGNQRVNDLAGLLPPAARQELEARLEAYEKKTGHQLAFLSVKSLEGDASQEFGIRVVDAWKLGDAERDDGVLMLVAVEDREVRIEVGDGLEGELTDALSGRIIRELITPAFKRGAYAEGISAGLGAIMAATGGEGTPLTQQPRRRTRPGVGFSPLLMLFLLALLFFGGGRGGRRGMLIGGLPMTFGGGFRGGGGFGGGGGGGFGGGGGGFGGGGASGKW